MKPHERDDPQRKGQLESKRHLVDGKATREEKRRKWEAKRRKREDQEAEEGDRAVWFQENSHFASAVSDNDLENAGSWSNSIQATTNDLVSSRDGIPDDLSTHLLPYFNIQETQMKEPPGSASSSETLFIAEGTETIRILIQQQLKSSQPLTTSSRGTNEETTPCGSLSHVHLKSIFVKPNLLFDPPVSLITEVNQLLTANESVDAAKDHAVPVRPSPGFHVLVGTESVLSKVAGFHISRGAMACGVVPTDRTEEWLNAYLARKLEGSVVADGTGRSKTMIRLLAMDGICDCANLGTMIRTASAFGMDAVVLSHDTCDAWYRRAIRVSMGHVFVRPIVRVKNLAAFVAKWGQNHDRQGNQAPAITSYAAVVDRSKDVLVLDELSRGDVPAAWCCVMGNEARGISDDVVKNCTHKIRIDMAEGVDSLSVPIACGILLHSLRGREHGSS